MRKVLVTAATFRPMPADLILVRPEIRGLAGSADKLLIEDFLTSAIAAYEDYTNNILCSSVWDLYLDEFPAEDDENDGAIDTPGPLVSITSVKYLDAAGAEQTLATSYYKAVTSHNPLRGLIALRYGQSWPSTYDEADAVYTRIVAGYASANAVPASIKDGLVEYIQERFSGINLSALYWPKWDAYRRIPV